MIFDLNIVSHLFFPSILLLIYIPRFTHPSIYNFYDQGLLTLLTLYNKIVVQTNVRVEVSAKSRIFYTSDITILGVHKKKLGFFFFFA